MLHYFIYYKILHHFDYCDQLSAVGTWMGDEQSRPTNTQPGNDRTCRILKVKWWNIFASLFINSPDYLRWFPTYLPAPKIRIRGFIQHVWQFKNFDLSLFVEDVNELVLDLVTTNTGSKGNYFKYRLKNRTRKQMVYLIVRIFVPETMSQTWRPWDPEERKTWGYWRAGNPATPPSVTKVLSQTPSRCIS